MSNENQVKAGKAKQKPLAINGNVANPDAAGRMVTIFYKQGQTDSIAIKCNGESIFSSSKFSSPYLNIEHVKQIAKKGISQIDFLALKQEINSLICERMGITHTASSAPDVDEESAISLESL